MTSEIGCLSSITLLLFLDTHKNSLSESVLIERLNCMTSNILDDSFDSALHTLINKNGWDESTHSFKVGELDIETLCSSLKLFIERRESKTSAIRASQVDVKNRIKSFAPDLLMTYTLERNVRSEKMELEPFSVFFDGVCLLADISGFTRLSGKFCEAGKNGIDQLQQVVNGYLGQLVKIVYAYGGDVMKFAGDALVCVFQPSRSYEGAKDMIVADTCSNAVQCATELAQICTEQLTIHVAVSCGSICFAMLGGHENVWECLVSGACLGDLSQCLDDAASQETVVSPQFVEMLGANYRKELNIEQLSSGNYRVISAVKINSLVIRKMIKRRGEMLMKDSESRFVMFPNDDRFLSTIALFVPTPVTVGLVSGTFDYLAELREVTTMFMSWDGYSQDEHRNLLSLQKYFIAAQKVLFESGGFIRQFLIDDKGCVLIACWGVPTASHPDNTRRALCAGAIIGYELSEIGMKTSVGITTGNVFCGSVGSYVRREYAVIGDVVNLAARLMSKAKGGLFIDEATFSRVPLFLQENLKKLAPMALKGKDIPITAYSLKKGSKKISLSDKEITGGVLSIRPVCKGPLVRGLERISGKEPVKLKCILLEGESGTGNVSVADWLKMTGPKMGLRVVRVLLSPEDTSCSYCVIARLFRLLVRESIFDDIDSRTVAVKQILRSVYKADTETIEKVAYPALHTALGVHSHATRKLPKRVLKECILSLFVHLLTKCPVVVVLEQIQLADEFSWEVLLELIGTVSYGLIVATAVMLEDIRLGVGSGDSATDAHRSLSRLTHNYKALTQLRSTILVKMSEYSVLDVDQLLCSVLDLDSCPTGTSAQVYQLSGGDPFWCKEMAQIIQSTGTGEFLRALDRSRDSAYESKDFIGSHPRTAEVFVTRAAGRYSKSLPGQGLSRRPWTQVTHESSGKLYGDGLLSSIHESARRDTTAKLELFIVCRLETLSREDQNILRTASIIGRRFSQETLYGILSPKMRTQMFDSVLSLVKTRWIVETHAKKSSDATVEYSFVHPLFYQTIYDLTPAGDKAILHYAVACYLEDAHQRSPSHYAQLGRHFGLAKDSRPKALEYFVRAAVYSLSNGPSFYEEGLELLSNAGQFADSAMDFGSILGVVADRYQRLLAYKKRREGMTLRSSSSTPNHFRSIKVQSSPPLRSSLDGLQPEYVEHFLQKFADIEKSLNRLYQDMVEVNCVGVVTDWQRPHLTRWKDCEERIEAEKRSSIQSRIDDPGSGVTDRRGPLMDGMMYCMRLASHDTSGCHQSAVVHSKEVSTARRGTGTCKQGTGVVRPDPLAEILLPDEACSISRHASRACSREGALRMESNEVMLKSSSSRLFSCALS